MFEYLIISFQYCHLGHSDYSSMNCKFTFCMLIGWLVGCLVSWLVDMALSPLHVTDIELYMDL